MLTDKVPSFELAQWAAPASVAIGGVFAFWVFFWTRDFIRRRKAAALPSPKRDDPSSDPFTHGNTRERRKSVRRRGNQLEVMISDSCGKTLPYRGIVLDRSVGGLRLAVDDLISVGNIISVRPSHVATIVPWIQVEICHCRKKDNGWELGCQFLHPPPSTILWMFG
ncbi:MAG TPA: PilZ domain-containing protein [Gemmataceae bacterium]|jgi:hypothetical protein|nr:PilZ domain-containing protein [Gemmataceae bacterium]